MQRRGIDLRETVLKWIVIMLIGAVHFGVSWFVVSVAGRMLMSRFDGTQPPSVFEGFIRSVSWVLLFPIVSLDLFRVHFSIGNLPIILNSIVWGACIYAFGGFLLRRARRR